MRTHLVIEPALLNATHLPFPLNDTKALKSFLASPPSLHPTYSQRFCSRKRQYQRLHLLKAMYSDSMFGGSKPIKRPHCPVPGYPYGSRTYSGGAPVCHGFLGPHRLDSQYTYPNLVLLDTIHI
jgi:hypothetical protein